MRTRIIAVVVPVLISDMFMKLRSHENLPLRSHHKTVAHKDENAIQTLNPDTFSSAPTLLVGYETQT